MEEQQRVYLSLVGLRNFVMKTPASLHLFIDLNEVYKEKNALVEKE